MILFTITNYHHHDQLSCIFCFAGFFIQGFPKLLRFQAHHDRILKKYLPKLKKHLDKNGIDTGIYTLKWFFQCFLDRVSLISKVQIMLTFSVVDTL